MNASLMNGRMLVVRFIVGGGEEYGTMVKTAKAASMSSTSDVRSEVQPPGTCDRHSPSN